MSSYVFFNIVIFNIVTFTDILMFQVQGGDSSGEDISALPAAPEAAPAKRGRKGAAEEGVEEVAPEAAPAKRGRRGAVVEEVPAPSPAKRGRSKKAEVVEEGPAKVASPVKEVSAPVLLEMIVLSSLSASCVDQDH